MLQRLWAEIDCRPDFAVSQKAETQGIYEVRGGGKKVSLSGVLQSFPPLKCTDFMKCVKEA